jgi:hypothetical protein
MKARPVALILVARLCAKTVRSSLGTRNCPIPAGRRRLRIMRALLSILCLVLPACTTKPNSLHEAPSSWAEPSLQGTLLIGIVSGPDGKPWPNALVTLRGEGSEVFESTTAHTDEMGRYRLGPSRPKYYGGSLIEGGEHFFALVSAIRGPSDSSKMSMEEFQGQVGILLIHSPGAVKRLDIRMSEFPVLRR